MKNSVKKYPVLIIIVLLTFIVSFVFSGCQSVEHRPDEQAALKIGVSVYDQYDTFVGEMMDVFKKELQKKETELQIPIVLLQENADKSQILQNTQVQNFIDSGCDVICINLVDRMDASTIIDMAEVADIPVIFFNRELVAEDLERWDKLFYVGAPALESGVIQGQIVSEICRNDWDNIDFNGDGIIQYVILEGEADHQDAVLRTEFSVKTIESDGFLLERLETQIANWSHSQAETKMNQLLAFHQTEIELILANNDDMALGAVDALSKHGYSTEDGYWPVIVGVDGTSIGQQALDDGFLAGTVRNDTQGQARGMLDLILWLTNQQELPSHITLQDGKYIRLPYKKLVREK